MLIGSTGTVESVHEATLRRAATTVLADVEFDHTDAREALRWLFKRALIGGTVDPNVHGTITLSLHNVTWETVLQEVARQIKASYRFDRGWLQIEGKDPGLIPEGIDFIPYYPFDDSRNSELAGAYRSIETGVTLGRGSDVHRFLSPSFRVREAGGVWTGASAVRRLVEIQRSYPSFDSVGLRYGEGEAQTADVEVTYSRPDGRRIFYHDFWRTSSGGNWTLFLRDGVVRRSAFDFRDEPLSKVLESAGQKYGVRFSIDPALDRRVDFDLTDLSLETFLWSFHFYGGHTLRLDGGVYRATQPNVVLKQATDPTNVPIPFVEFERTDVRVALSWLFQKVNIGYRFDPQVKGLITVSLRNVTFEVALQNIVRQAEATYRIENGIYEVVPRYEGEKPLPPLADHREIDRVYESFRYDAKPARFLPHFRFAPEGTPAMAGPAAHEGFLQVFRSRPKFQVLNAVQLIDEKGVPTKAGILVRYEIGPNGETQDFWDVWVRRARTPWRLAASEVYYPPILNCPPERSKLTHDRALCPC